MVVYRNSAVKTDHLVRMRGIGTESIRLVDKRATSEGSSLRQSALLVLQPSILWRDGLTIDEQGLLIFEVKTQGTGILGLLHPFVNRQSLAAFPFVNRHSLFANRQSYAAME